MSYAYRSKKKCANSCRKISRVRRRFLIESLENRRVLAGDLWCDQEPTVFSELSASIDDSLFSKYQTPLAERAGAFTPTGLNLIVDAESLPVSILNYQVALKHSEARMMDPSIWDQFGMRFVRGIGAEYAVYEIANFGEQLGSTPDVYFSFLASPSLPVFKFGEANMEAVLMDEVIVSLKDGVQASSYFADDARFSSYRPLTGTHDQFIAKISAGVGTKALEVATALHGDPLLEWAYPNFYQKIEKSFFPNDTRFGNLWHVHNTGQGGGLIDADVDLPEAWDITPGGSSSIVVAVVDDGIPLNHPDLNPWVNAGEIVGNGVDDDGNGWVDDVNGWNFVFNNNISLPTAAIDVHGTAVAGIATARGNNGLGVVGAAYNSSVLSVRIFEGDNSAQMADVASALYYAAGRTANGLGTWKAADVVNSSWNFGPSGVSNPVVNTALLWGTTQGRLGSGATYFFSSGNYYSFVSEPGRQSSNIPGVISVGATNNFGTLADYSNNGNDLDFVAPSSDSRPGYLAIDTTDRVGNDGYSTDDYTGTGGSGFGGTSASSPFAAGIGALVLSRAKDLNVPMTASALRGLLRNTSDMIDTTNQAYSTTTGKNLLYGYGRINAANAVAGVGKTEISVVSAREELVSGLSTTSFGSVYVGQPNELTYRIRNQGTSPLNVSSISISGANFSLIAGNQPTILNVGESASFTVQLIQSVVGNANATVTILSNDLDEPSFTFNVTANLIAPSISGAVFEDWNGNGAKDSIDTSNVPSQLVYLDTNNNGIYDTNLSTNTYQQTTSAPILDNTTTSSQLIVSGSSGSITDLDITLNIQHDWSGDLRVVLVAPSGESVLLFSNVGRAPNFTGTTLDDEATIAIENGTPPFTGSFRPTQGLFNFDGMVANGTWTLQVTDTATLDQGTLLNWSMRVMTGEQTARTKANGYFQFTNLAQGNYVVGPVAGAGYTQTGPTSYLVNLNSAGSFAINRDFGLGRNNRFYGSVFNDLNGNGLWEGSEQSLAGRRIYVDANANTAFDGPITSSIQSGPLNIVIPDNTTRTFTLNVAGLMDQISDVNVLVNINMTSDTDLEVFLIHPDGTRIELFTKVGGSGDNFTNTLLDDQASISIDVGLPPYNGSFKPEGLLASLNGKSPAGSWTLEIRDRAGSDQATLLNWGLFIENSERFAYTNALGVAAIDLTGTSQTVRNTSVAGWVPTLPGDSARTVNVTGVPFFDQRFGVKAPPFLASNSNAVSGFEGTTLTNTGSWSDADVPPNNVTLTASVGSVVKNANGTWSWSLPTNDQQASTQVTITANDGTGNTATTSFQFTVLNAAPTVSRSNASVSGNVLATITNTGTYSDVPADTVTLTASIGNVVSNGNGTWSWSFVPSSRIVNQNVTITAMDEDGGTSTTTFSFDALVAITNRKVFYAGSDFEILGGINAALEGSKELLRANNSLQATTAANVVNYSKGINGIVLDIAGLVGTALSTADLVFRVAPSGAAGNVTPSNWSGAPTPQSISVLPGTNSTPARVVVQWLDNLIQDTWLQIIVNANTNTGLINREVFYIGHASGDVDGEFPMRVTTLDVASVRSVVGNSIVSVSDARDIDKDRRVTTADVAFVRTRVSNTVLLNSINVPAAGSTGEGEWAGSSSPPTPAPMLLGYLDDYFVNLNSDHLQSSPVTRRPRR